MPVEYRITTGHMPDYNRTHTGLQPNDTELRSNDTGERPNDTGLRPERFRRDCERSRKESGEKPERIRKKPEKSGKSRRLLGLNLNHDKTNDAKRWSTGKMGLMELKIEYIYHFT